MTVAKHVSNITLLVGLLSLSVAFAVPRQTHARSIVDAIIYPKFSTANVDSLSIFARALTPTTSQAAGIQRSRLGYAQTSGSVVGLTIPAVGVTRGIANMSGTITLTGKLASDIDDLTERLVRNYSEKLQDFYRREKRNLQTRAKGSYFFFFQAAANYGYSDDKETRRFLADAEFQSFANAAKELLASESTTTLEGRFKTGFEYHSEGRRETLTIFGWVYINQVTVDSGKIFNVVKRNADLVMADSNGDVRQENPGEMKFNIKDKIRDITLTNDNNATSADN